MLVTACGPSGSPAYQTYVGFVSAIVTGDCPGMYARVEKQATEFVDNLCTPRTTVVLGNVVNLGSVASNVASMRPTATPFMSPIVMERTVESETASADGREVRLVVTEKSYERNGNLLEPTWTMRHRLAVRYTGAYWKISRFSEEVLERPGGKAAK